MPFMNELITIRIKDKKPRKVIESPEEIKFIQVVTDPTPRTYRQKKETGQGLFIRFKTSKAG
jgi:hypothetical protein